MPVQKITPEIAEQMQADRNSGMTVRQVARKYSCATGTVSMCTEQPEWSKNTTPKETLLAIQADRNAGMPLKQIAEKYHVSMTTVYKRTTNPTEAYEDDKDYFSAEEREQFDTEWDYWRLRVLRGCGRDI